MICLQPLAALSSAFRSHMHIVYACNVIYGRKCCVPGLIKVDVDSAFRRVPLLPEHRWAAAVAFLVAREALASFHYAMPFGAVGSVHAWERVGAFLLVALRKLLHIPLFRYVDDYFTFDRPVGVVTARLALCHMR